MNKIQIRSVTSILLMWSAAGLLFTGVVLFVMPPGRIAYWTGWSWLGLGKDQWGDLHIVLGLLFVITSGIHLVLNWTPFLRYLKAKAASAPSQALIVSTVAVLLVSLATIWEVPPFNQVGRLERHLKQSWVSPETKPPVPHAELMPLGKLAELASLSPQEAMKRLKAAGWQVTSPKEKVKKLAQRNHKTPNELWYILTR